MFKSFVTSSAYVNSLRLRILFFTVITLLFLIAISIGISVQSLYFMIAQKSELSVANTLVCVIGIPIFFLASAVICDDMLSLLFDAMDRPPLLSARAQMTVSLAKNDDHAFKLIKMNNLIILLSLELIPAFSGALLAYDNGTFYIKDFLGGYIIGGAIFSISLSVYYMFSHAINSRNATAQDAYYDYLKRLEILESSKGFLASSHTPILNYKTQDHDTRVKNSNPRLAKYFLVLSIFTLLSIIVTVLSIDVPIIISIFLTSTFLILTSTSIKYFVPKFLGPSFNILLFIYLMVSISLAYLGHHRSNLMAIKLAPIISSDQRGTNDKIALSDNMSYPICSMRWGKPSMQEKNKSLTLLDIIPINNYLYSSDPEDLNDEDIVEKHILDIFKNTSVGKVSVEHIGSRNDFSRSVILYFHDYEIRLMALRGTMTNVEVFYDLNSYSFVQVLNIFQNISPIIGLLPEKIRQKIISAGNLSNLFGISDLISEIEATADVFHSKSMKNGDQFIITGHSLGGLLAGVISSKLGVPGIALSPPGNHSLIAKYEINSKEDIYSSLTTVIMDKDPVSKVDTHVGSLHKLACAYDGMACHYPTAMICEIYTKCGDARGRSIPYDCDPAGFYKAAEKTFGRH